MQTKERLELTLVEDFVTKCHADLLGVKELLVLKPALINSAWDWGDGDWETGLGGASHMGRRDIALTLLEAGARLDVFAASMLGYLDVVREAVLVRPDLPTVLGPHGIPLIAHAEAGGDDARNVVAFLRSLNAGSL